MTVTDGGTVRIGVFGGTFDPPHNAHLAAAAAARDVFGLSEVLMMPAGDPWQKTASAPITPAHHRLAMTRLLIEGVDRVVASDVEVRRNGPSFTVDTLRQLSAPGVTLMLIVGSDALAGLPTWERPKEVLELADIAVVQRDGPDDPAQSGPDVVAMMAPDRSIQRFVIPRMDISSSDLRRRMRNGLTVDGLLPWAVASYALHHGIYRDQL